MCQTATRALRSDVMRRGKREDLHDGIVMSPGSPTAVEVDLKQRLVRRREAYQPATGSPAAAILQASVDLGVGASFRAVLVTAGHPRSVHPPDLSLVSSRPWSISYKLRGQMQQRGQMQYTEADHQATSRLDMMCRLSMHPMYLVSDSV